MKNHGFDHAPVSRRRLLLGLGSSVVVASADRFSPALAFDDPSAPRAGRFDAKVPTAWFDLALRLVRATPGFTPPVASRAFAYAGITLYAAMVPGMPGYRSLEGQLPGLAGLPRDAGRAGLHWPAAANAALGAILRDLFPTAPAEDLAAVDALDASFGDRFRRRVARSVLSDSEQWGAAVAELVFDWSKDDGGHEGYLRNFPVEYITPVGPGLWQPTPPAFLPALQPFWGANRTFAIADGSACPAGDPTPYSQDPSSAFWAEAFEVYDTVSNLTDEQRAIALFWADDPGVTATPPGHSVSIATQALRAMDAGLDTAAETYAKVGMAVADAFIACWYAKYGYNLLRPVTYVQAFIDAAWLPPLVTPPFPEYTSGHSVQSAAAAQVLTDLFGRRYAFVDRTHEDRGLPARSFDSFYQAAGEAAISRLYGGIHYRPAIARGLEQGRCVGQAVSSLEFRRRRGRERKD
jgi:hypothetical protein